jgi:hypothetical protein
MSWIPRRLVVLGLITTKSGAMEKGMTCCAALTIPPLVYCSAE